MHQIWSICSLIHHLKSMFLSCTFKVLHTAKISSQEGRTSENMRDDGFHRVLMSDSSFAKYDHGTVHVKYMTEFLRRDVEFYRNEEIMSSREQRNAFSSVVSPSMTTDYI